MRPVLVRTGPGTYRQRIEIGPHVLVADEPADAGGDDAGPSPLDFLLAALGACTSMTVKMYAERKGWPLRGVEVRLEQGREGDAHVIRRKIALEGDLTGEQRQRLLEIANKCPVHRTLTGTIRVESELG